MGTEVKYQPRVEKIEKIWIPETKLWIPHDSGEIAFAFPAFGPDTYKSAGQDILSKNLKVPTGDCTPSLLYSAYCSDALNEPEFEKVRNIMRSNWLWVFNKNFWTEKGVYVIQDKNAIGRIQLLNVSDLEKALKDGKETNGIRFSKERNLRFAPKGSYNLKDNTPESFAKDGFIIASCGKDGAEKLGEVSTKFKNKPYIDGLEVQEGQEPELRVSAVYEDGDRLRFVGSVWDDYEGSCHAFGVF